MQTATKIKTLCLAGLTSALLISGASQADPGFHRPMYNPPAVNPYLAPPADFRQHVSQFDARLDAQLQRILTGMETGKLTLREAVGLLREHQAINALERQFLADGRLGPRELADLDHRLDAASRHIAAEKHDGERLGFNHHDGRYMR